MHFQVIDYMKQHKSALWAGFIGKFVYL